MPATTLGRSIRRQCPDGVPAGRPTMVPRTSIPSGRGAAHRLGDATASTRRPAGAGPGAAYLARVPDLALSGESCGTCEASRCSRSSRGRCRVHILREREPLRGRAGHGVGALLVHAERRYPADAVRMRSPLAPARPRRAGPPRPASTRRPSRRLRGRDRSGRRVPTHRHPVHVRPRKPRRTPLRWHRAHRGGRRRRVHGRQRRGRQSGAQGFAGPDDVWTDLGSGYWRLRVWILRPFQNQTNVFADSHPCLGVGGAIYDETARATSPPTRSRSRCWSRTTTASACRASTRSSRRSASSRTCT